MAMQPQQGRVSRASQDRCVLQLWPRGVSLIEHLVCYGVNCSLEIVTPRWIAPSPARWARASTAAKKGESLLSVLYFDLLTNSQNSHSKSECPKPRVFKGTCRICEKEGHPAVDCPERPPDVCKNCQAEGHKTMECKENRKFDLNRVADMLPHEGWAAMKKASDERDLDDFREVPLIHMYLESFELWLT